MASCSWARAKTWAPWLIVSRLSGSPLCASSRATAPAATYRRRSFERLPVFPCSPSLESNQPRSFMACSTCSCQPLLPRRLLWTRKATFCTSAVAHRSTCTSPRGLQRPLLLTCLPPRWASSCLWASGAASSKDSLLPAPRFTYRTPITSPLPSRRFRTTTSRRRSSSCTSRRRTAPSLPSSSAPCRTLRRPWWTRPRTCSTRRRRHRPRRSCTRWSSTCARPRRICR
mmetsp:Transcript_14120/g.32936  ORF Transcript_14120/g.32936 Transcript_14120/m.32936 type:complete len:228 (+) Transcript_14120:2193-2876(+)